MSSSDGSSHLSLNCHFCGGHWTTWDSYWGTGHEIGTECPLKPPHVPSGNRGCKQHLPASNQSTRWLGAILHQQDRAIVTRCGQTHSRGMLDKYHPQLIVGSYVEATCRRCLRSLASEIMGPTHGPLLNQDVIEKRIGLHEAWTSRIRHNKPPIGEHEVKAFLDLDAILKQRLHLHAI